MRVRSHFIPVLALLLLTGLLGFYHLGRDIWLPVYHALLGKETVASVVAKYGPEAEARLRPYFTAAGVQYPPSEIKLLAMKAERRLELWARDSGEYRWIRDYPIQAASGGPGPKLREGDRQVPEGRYRIIGLNPNSGYHLSMKLNYPNSFDLKHARREGRDRPGSNIFIHGKAVSIGCLAMGDPAIEELFTLVHKLGKVASEVLIAPHDPRTARLSLPRTGAPSWLPQIYDELREEFAKYRDRRTAPRRAGE